MFPLFSPLLPPSRTSLWIRLETLKQTEENSNFEAWGINSWKTLITREENVGMEITNNIHINKISDALGCNSSQCLYSLWRQNWRMKILLRQTKVFHSSSVKKEEQNLIWLSGSVEFTAVTLFCPNSRCYLILGARANIFSDIYIYIRSFVISGGNSEYLNTAPDVALAFRV